MKLQEEHKVFVVKHFARFMKLTDIVEAFMEKFEDDLPPFEWPEVSSVQALFEGLLEIDEDPEKQEFIEEFIKAHTEEFQAMYGDEADQKLNARALEAYEKDRRAEATECHNEYQKDAEEGRQRHLKDIQQNLFNRFRRLNIDHPQFPNKYRTLFKKTRDAYCDNYRSQSLNIPENLARELETLYGYQKQLIFQGDSPKEATKHLNSAHQILKTVLAHNALNADQQIEDITPQNPKALKGTQKALPKPPKEES
ncbi:MAG: hypothetical protein OXI24_02040 [Candidatus Poribacteria bacterium]|nr:hypothetical protein [Candidatus Poribacteria bacterium]